MRKVSTPTAARGGHAARGGFRGGNNNQRPHQQHLTPSVKPIITVTEFTPGTTPDRVSSSNGDGDDSEGIEVAESIRVPTKPAPSNRSSTRSRTDSLVSYAPTVVNEAPGSTFYINRKGEMDFTVLLKVRYIIRNRIWTRSFLCALRQMPLSCFLALHYSSVSHPLRRSRFEEMRTRDA